MKSMTAYAHVYRKKKSQSLHLVIRSLNYKYLDTSIHNLPPEDIVIEEKIKGEIKKMISRGKIEVYIFLKKPLDNEIHVDEKILARYVVKTRQLAKKYGLEHDVKVSDFLNLPQVVWSEEKKKSQENLVIPALREGLHKLLQFKEKGGVVIQNQMLKNLRRLKANILEIHDRRQTLKFKINSSEQSNNKEDIDEEVSLSSFYINRLEKNITSKKAGLKGKSIDFLTQEIMRELNAASSKTNDKTFASLIVEAKNYVDRIREQAQNIE